MNNVKEQIEKLEQKKKEFDQQIAEHDITGHTFEKIYEQDDLQIWKEIIVRDDRVWISLTSSCHWTSEAIELRFSSDFGGDPKWSINFGSGGTLACPPEMIAESMKLMFVEAEKIIKRGS